MHNCKKVQKKLIDLAMSQNEQSQLPPAELENCPACREEFASLRNALRATKAVVQLAQPAESFWPAYNQRLRDRLERQAQTPDGWIPPPPDSSSRGRLRKLLTISIPVPLPVASALLVFFIFSVFFLLRARSPKDTGRILTPPSVVTRTIEVPVVQEKLITRVVYLKPPTAPGTVTSRRQDIANAVNYVPPEAPAETPQTLEGFKPANEAKLTIIKGSYPNEK